MAEYARPNSDVAAGTWTVTPLWQKIDETPYDDVDFISGPSRASSTCQIGLSSVPDPVVHTGHIMRVRAYLSNTGVTLTFELRNGTTLRKAWNPGVTTGSFQTFTLTLTEAEAGTLSSYSDLVLYCIQTYTSGTGTRRSYISWFEFEVPSNNVNLDETASTDIHKGITAVPDFEFPESITQQKYKGITTLEQLQALNPLSIAKFKGISALSNINAGELAQSISAFKGVTPTGNLIVEEELWTLSDSGLSLPLKASSNNRYLVDQNNTPVFLAGDAAWELLQQVPDADQDVYLANRQDKGFNTVMIEAIEHQFCDNAPNDYYNNPPFTSTPFTTPNETYFARLDALLTKMEGYGMCALLFPLYLGYDPSEDGWDTETAAASNADMTWWGNYLGDRYKDYPNIIWVLGGDRDPTTLATKLDFCADAILAADPNHLITVHAYRHSLATDYDDLFPWLTLNDIYPNYLDISHLSGEGYAYSPTMPLFDIEATYEGNGSLQPQEIRTEMYWSILAGGCGYIFGNSVVWNLGYLGGNWKTAMDLQGSYDMSRCATFFKSKEWYNLVPDSGHTVLTSGYGTINTGDYATCARVSDGSLVIIYEPMNRTMTIDMTKLRGTVTCRWFDPTNGSYATDVASPLPNTGTHDFSHPGSNSASDGDWVLVLEA